MRQIQISPSITTIDSHSMKSYLNDVSRIPVLTADEEAKLATQIREGGKEGKKAMDRLVTANLRFVISVAKTFQGQEMPLEDLINEGNIGLINAAKRFDPTLGFKFISYAVWHIRQSIQQALLENGRIVRLPYNEARFLDKLDRTINKFMMKNQRQPSIGELSELLSETENRIRSAMKSDVRSLSIDAPFREDGERCLNDMLPASEESRADYQTEKESLTIELRSVLDKTLTPNERRVIARLFGLDGFPKSLVEIASETGFSSERIRQIRESSLNRLRNSKHSKMLRTYL